MQNDAPIFQFVYLSRFLFCLWADQVYALFYKLE